MKLRKQTYSLEQYLKLMNNETIRSDQDCQRLSGQWSNNMVNELIYTVLTDNYIPPVILGEEIINGITRLWLIDGLQRSSSLALFRYGNKKITQNIDESIVTYQRKVLDENGNPKRDGKGEIIWESIKCDIRNKTYNQLPDELRDKFNEYQIETVIHQDCDTTGVSKLIKRYNNHTAMNTNQKAFTYLDTFAREVRQITENRFFLDIYSCTQKGRINGTIERVCCDMIFLCNYPDQYRKDTKQNFKWLNENACISDFENLNGLLTRLTDSLEITAETKELFNVKHAHIFVSIFKTFIEIGRNDEKFGDFLDWFVKGGNETEIDGKTWNDLILDEKTHSTRDVNIIDGKLNYLTALIRQYTTETKEVA